MMKDSIFLIFCILLPALNCQKKDRSKAKRLRFPSIVLVDSIATGESAANGETPFLGSLTSKHTCSEEQRKSKFRSADGSCNNLEHPAWGQAGASYLRMISDHYDDDESVPRQTSELGSLLPSARTVSQEVFNSESHPSARLTQMAMQWGQFLDHDLASTPAEIGIKWHFMHLREDCFPIYIEEGDSYFTSDCMGFARSQRYEGHTTYGKRQQFNTITSFIDGSMVYGSSEEEMLMLRAGEDGLMSTTDVPGGESFLPNDSSPGACKNQDDVGIFCFLAGDARVNVIPGLQAMHTLFVRFHNRIATELKTISEVKNLFKMTESASNNDEFLYQTARKIVAAVIQRITYKDYIPSVFGREFVHQFKLDQPYEYKPSVNPQIINEFTTAAFRYGHSLITDSMKLNGKDVPLHELYFNTVPVLKNFSQVITNLIEGRSENSDKYFSKEMTDKLFLTSKGSLDIVSLNIQRGRDHGLPSFAEYRKICKLPPVKRFEDFGDCGRALRNVYKSPMDVDLYAGAICEKPHGGNEVGPTFACIIGTQLYTLKNGDRFFYTTLNHNLGFTAKQLQFINKITLSSLFCEFGEIGEVQSNVFFPSNRINRVRKCNNFAVPWTRDLFEF
ncbi:hypothetical protein LOTGIDRAFT_152002 [Lottia gigantea]|uniref:Peroxidase n=1 Tax=Lottia gigantea TaxID=225164 RepID=V4BGY9_LOTGI|nr:hypothetical protein LOTGIDRAFT_152002 [Lottia gigantea]ESP05192.1 hypothetical protein LOTGIDRAFT_152002 [Lottia gigantea]